MLSCACGRTPLSIDTFDASTDARADTPLTDLHVSAGLGFVCAARRGEAWCWGKNSCGELGACLSPFDPPRTTPVRVELDEPVVQVDAGWHACAVVESGRVYCWGIGTSGQIGDGRMSGCHRCPTLVEGIQATQVSAGVISTCAVLNDGDVACWGSNDDGRLGDTALVHHLVPHRLGLSGVTSIAQDDRHTCARHRDGSVTCWGANNGGQLGIGSLEETGRLVQAPAEDVTSVDVGGQRTCVLASGRLQCWGTGEAGNLGTGAREVEALSPVTLSLRDVASFDLTSAASCATRLEGSVYCWGSNLRGELGDGSMRMRTRPHRLSELHDMVGVTISEGVGCAWNASEQIYCWGGNANGEVGNGTTEPSYTPTRVLTPW